MIANITYALVLFVHPNPEPRVYASFTTAEACRTERAAVARDLEGSQITVACVPQERLNMNAIESQMQIIMNTMRNLHQDMPGSKDF